MIRKTTRPWIIAFSCMCAAIGLTSATHGQDVEEKRFAREVRVEVEQEELVAAPLDGAVYQASGSSLAGIRIWDRNGAAVPYLLQRVQAMRSRTKRRTWTASKPNVKPLEGGGLEITLQLDDDDPPVDAMRVVSPLRNFEQRIRVFTSSDGRQWKPLGGESVLFDYSQYMDVRNEEVKLPKTEHRRFRIVVDALTSELQSRLMQLTRRLRGGEETDREEKVVIERRPFRIERIEFMGEVVKEQVVGDKQQMYEVGDVRIEEDADNQQTLVYVDTPLTPLTSFQLETDTRNFSRRVTVAVKEQRGKETQWRSLSTAVLSRLDFKDLRREQLEISFPETRTSSYRLAIDNHDSPPLSIQGVRSLGNVYHVVFLAAPDKQYQLVYGSVGEAEAPTYDTAAIRAAMKAGFTPAEAALGEPGEIEGQIAQADPSWLAWLRDARILAVLLVALVIVLALALLSANRRLSELPAEKK